MASDRMLVTISIRRRKSQNINLEIVFQRVAGASLVSWLIPAKVKFAQKTFRPTGRAARHVCCLQWGKTRKFNYLAKKLLDFSIVVLIEHGCLELALKQGRSAFELIGILDRSSVLGLQLIAETRDISRTGLSLLVCWTFHALWIVRASERATPRWQIRYWLLQVRMMSKKTSTNAIKTTNELTVPNKKAKKTASLQCAQAFKLKVEKSKAAE